MYIVNFSLEKFQPSHLIFPLTFRTFLLNMKQLSSYDLEIESFFLWVIVTIPSIVLKCVSVKFWVERSIDELMTL